MGRFSRKKRRAKAPVVLTPRRYQGEKCPCGEHLLSAPPDWSTKACCGSELEPLVGMDQYAKCNKCRRVWWCNPENDKLEKVSLAGMQTLGQVLVVRI